MTRFSKLQKRIEANKTPVDIPYDDMKKYLNHNGFYLDRIHGSHHIYKNKDNELIVIPIHSKSIKAPYVSKAVSIIKGEKMVVNKNFNYRFKAFQIDTTDGWQWVIEFIDVPNIIGGGDTVEEAYYEALENLNVYFDYLKENGEPIPQPTKEPEYTNYSGKLVLRLSKNNHSRIAQLAELENISINSLINEMITEGISNRISKKAVKQLVNDLEKEYTKENKLSLKLSNN